jgi:hypothetical protein
MNEEHNDSWADFLSTAEYEALELHIPLVEEYEAVATVSTGIELDEIPF